MMESRRNNRKNNRISYIKVRILVLAAALFLICFAFAGCAGRDAKPQDAGSNAGQNADQNAGQDADQDAARNGERASGLQATLFFASDYQKETGFGEPADNLAAVLDAVTADGKEPETVVICGDYTNDRVLHDYQLSPEESIEEIKSVVNEKLPDLKRDTKGEGDSGTGRKATADSRAEAEKIMLVQGNHDSLTDSLADSGLHEYDDYLIYVLNTQNDFPWKQGKVSGCLDKVTRASAEMKKCFDDLIASGETRPVIIAGHVPLHFTARTSSKHTTGDNLYSSLIFDTVNEAAESLDIIYLFGHNHTKGWDCYMGGSCVYKAPGDTILIPEFEKTDVNTDSFSERRLNFTYMNAGYIGHYMNCSPAEAESGRASEYAAADETLTAAVCEIYTDKIVITRYSADGVHRLGARGEGDPYKNNIDSDLIPEKYYSNETASPQTVIRKASKH